MKFLLASCEAKVLPLLESRTADKLASLEAILENKQKESLKQFAGELESLQK